MSLLLGIFLLLCLPYSLLPEKAAAFPWFFALYTAQFILYAIILLRLKQNEPSLLLILLVAILARILMLSSDPVLENDYYRYLWDGRVMASGVNPYSYKPLDTALDHLEVPYRHKIGWKQYGTIYPPVSIGVFALSHIIASDSFAFLKIVLSIFEFATGILLVFWLQKLKVNPKWSMVYFLNPLVLKEVSNSAHLDSIVVFFSVLAVYQFWQYTKAKQQHKGITSWFFLALATGAKLYPLCFVPYFFKLDTRRLRGIAIFGATLALLYLPFISANSHLFNGTEAFAKHWIFNASFYRIFDFTIPKLLEVSSLSDYAVEYLLSHNRLAKLLVGVIFLSFVIARSARIKSVDDLPRELLHALGLLLILSPVVNAWYLLWLIPFAVMEKSKPWLLFSYLVVASYSWWYSQHLALYLRWAEYLIFFSYLGYSMIENYRRNSQAFTSAQPNPD